MVFACLLLRTIIIIVVVLLHIVIPVTAVTVVIGVGVGVVVGTTDIEAVTGSISISSIAGGGRVV